MKLNILQKDFLPVLQSVSRSSGSKNLPVLSNVLLESVDGALQVSATNLEIGVIKTVKAKIIEKGAITIPAKALLEIVSSLLDESIEIETNGDQIKLTTERFNSVLNGIPASEFPVIPLSKESGVFIESRILSKYLPQITFAAANDEGRPVLTGVLTEFNGKTLSLVATDGFRLAHKTLSLESEVGANFKALIPRKTFEEVVRIIVEETDLQVEEKVGISASENQNQVIFKVGKVQVSSRLIDGQFPAWEKIIPASFKARAILNKSEFLKAVKLSSIFAKDASSIVKLKIEKGIVTLSSEAKELGNQETKIISEVEGEELTIAFNGKFLSDALNAASSSQVSIEFSGNLSPALITPIGEDGLEYVVMPIRLS